MAISAVFFDLDDTLHDTLKPFERTFETVFPQYDHSVPVTALYKRFRFYSDLLWKEYSRQLLTLEELRIQRMALALKSFDIPISTEGACHFQSEYEIAQKNIELFPEVPELLVKLHEMNIVVGVITNGPVDHQYNKIRTLDLMKYFSESRIFISDEVGSAKPDTRIFQYAAEKVKLPSQTILYVGDSWMVDIVGAHKAGWKAVWYNHRMRKAETADQPMAEITNLSSLLKLIST